MIDAFAAIAGKGNTYAHGYLPVRGNGLYSIMLTNMIQIVGSRRASPISSFRRLNKFFLLFQNIEFFDNASHHHVHNPFFHKIK